MLQFFVCLFVKNIFILQFLSPRTPIIHSLLDQELISYRYSSCSSSCWGDLFKKPRLRRFLCDVILSRWRPWRCFTQKSAASWWVHLLGTYAAASASSWSIVNSYLFV